MTRSSLAAHYDELNDAAIALEQAVVAAAVELHQSPRSKRARHRLALATRGMLAAEAVLEELGDS